MSGVPADGTAVVLRDQRAAPTAARWPAPSTACCSCSRPRDLPAGAFSPGTRLLVAWPDETSLRVLPVMLLNVATADGRCWPSRSRAPPGARSAGATPGPTSTPRLSIGYDRRRTGSSVETSGELIDLSEAALRGVVPPEHQALCRPRTPVRVRIELADDSFDISGYVLQGKPAARLDLGLEVVVLFHRPVPRVEELRRHLGGTGRGRQLSTGRAAGSRRT